MRIVSEHNSKMGEPFVIITEHVSQTQVQVPIHTNTTVEEAVIYVCRKLNIKPIARHLFGLKYDKNQWTSLSTKLWEFKVTNFELRIRFKFPEFVKLLRTCEHTFNYYFHQVKNDLISDKIQEVTYDKRKGDVLGLCVTDMYREMLESNVSKDNLLDDYKKYVPKELINCHKFFLKKPLKAELLKLEQSKFKSSSELKQIYIQRFEDLVPNYMIEKYVAKMDEHICEKDITLLVDPYHKEMPGIQYCYTGKDEWIHLCTFDDLCCISLHPDGKAEISRKNGIPIYLKMNNNSLVSFITLLDGYYRLSIKWTFNLCKDFITPSLQSLQNVKCHGPVGITFSLKKLEEKRKNKPGCFLLRECENDYDVFFIDVCNSNRRVVSYKIEHRGEGLFWFSGDKDCHTSISALIAKYRSPVSSIPMLECIPPSEYDVTNLLLCRLETNSMKKSKEVELNEQAAPLIINFRDLHIRPGMVYEGRWGLTQMRRYIWKTDAKRMEVAVKCLKPGYTEYYLDDFLQLAAKWAHMRSASVVKLLGVTLANVSMVSEFFPLGPLDVYLQQNRTRLEEVDLVEAATYIASALWHMESEGIVHGYLRCRKIFVAFHIENSFSVKVADPGLHPNFDDNDCHWIPPELYDSPKDVYRNTSADVWAFGTVLWELFSYGQPPIMPLILTIRDFYRSGDRLPKPSDCSREIYSLMSECWHSDPDQRKKPQAAMRDMNQLLYQVHNARRSHSYAAAKPMNRMDSEETLNEVSSAALDDHSEITSQRTTMSTVDSTHIDLNSSSFSFPDEGLFVNTNVFGRSPFFRIPSLDDNDATSICSASSLNDLKIVFQGTIGKGFYGEVYKGYIESPDSTEVREVAVKKLITDKASCLPDFEREISIMKNLKHPNIVNMIGVIQHPEISLIMEFVPHGSLKCYLITHKDLIPRDRLLKYSLDVAEGMHYLGQQKIIHRDLAARNVLVANERHVKISDFGLAQKMDPSNYYMIKTPRELPLRWYAPESLRDGKFSHFSDVWSYGVLLYEMFSFGGDPIIKNEGSDQKSLLEVLDSGARLACPEMCPVDVYRELMIPCWEKDDKKRPSFIKIIQIIRSI